MKRIQNYANTVEVCYYFFSSEAETPEDALNSLTLETCGNCLGPDDFVNEVAEEALAYLSAHWSEAEEMPAADVDERIAHLAEEWELSPEELAYLK